MEQQRRVHNGAAAEKRLCEKWVGAYSQFFTPRIILSCHCPADYDKTFAFSSFPK